MAETSAQRLADFILFSACKREILITNLKLQKLLYYSQAWYLAIADRPLFDERIEACLRRFADKSDGAPLPPTARGPQTRARNAVVFGARALLYRMSGVDLTVIEGINETTALVILSEIGTDVSRFPSEKNFVSWLGLLRMFCGSRAWLLPGERRTSAR